MSLFDKEPIEETAFKALQELLLKETFKEGAGLLCDDERNIIIALNGKDYSNPTKEESDLYLFAKEFFKGAIKPIIISREEPCYSQKFKSDSPIIIDKLKKILLLGEFNPISKEITLYIKNIRAVANKTSLDSSILLGSVYIHELIHAFYDHDLKKYNELKFLEEPIAEFGSIVFIRNYLANRNNSNEVVLSLRNLINDKKNNPAISFYGYGADLYDRFENKELKELLDIIKRFKKFSLSREDHSILDKYDRLWKSGDLNCHNKEEMNFKDLLFRIIQ